VIITSETHHNVVVQKTNFAHSPIDLQFRDCFLLNTQHHDVLASNSNLKTDQHFRKLYRNGQGENKNLQQSSLVSPLPVRIPPEKDGRPVRKP